MEQRLCWNQSTLRLGVIKVYWNLITLSFNYGKSELRLQRNIRKQFLLLLQIIAV